MRNDERLIRATALGAQTGSASSLTACAAIPSGKFAAVARDVVMVAVIFASVMLPCISAWTAFGVILRRFLTRRAALRAFNITMATLLMASLYPIWQSLGGARR